ncbi:MAG: hypothetical protein RIC35_12190 [Marinoscillum sp.]
MIRQTLLPLLAGIVILSSCNEDFGSKTVTYLKATAEYGDLEAMRSVSLTGHAREITDPGKIFVYNNVILVGEEGFGIHIIDNTDPANPAPLSFINIPGNREYFVLDGFLYAESVYDMLKIDIHDIHNPVLSGRIINAFTDPLYNSDGEAVIGFEYTQVTEKLEIDDPIFEYETSDNIYYYDFANSLIPPSAVPASFAGNSSSGIGSVNRIVAYDNYVYAVSREKMTVYESENDFTQVFNSNLGWEMETVYPLGDRLFVGARNSVDIYDITDRGNPSYISGYAHMTSCDPVLPVNEETAYVTLRTGDFSECPGDNNELLVLDITESNFTNQVMSIQMDSPYGMTLIGDRLYVGEGKHGLKVFDVTDRRSPQLISSDNSTEAYDVLIHPTYSDILLLANSEGLMQVRVDVEQNLQFVSNIKF